MLKLWERLPEVALLNEKGQLITRQNLLGNYTVIYFYPRAFTAGCTQEGQDFSDKMGTFCNLQPDFPEEKGLVELQQYDVRVIGVSPDKPESQARFKNKYQLKFELLSDQERKLAGAFAALKENGKSILRSTFILDRLGRLRKTWYGVKVKGHVEEVLQGVKEVISQDWEYNPQIKSRRAWRALSPATISRAELDHIIGAAHLASSCFNYQPWRFTVIDDKETLRELQQALSSGNYWAKQAAVLIAVHTERELDCTLKDGRDYYLFDTGQAVAYLQLQATQLGIIAHPMAGYSQQKFKEILNIPERQQVITVLALGYPADNLDFLNQEHQQSENAPRIRKKLTEVVNWNKIK